MNDKKRSPRIRIPLTLFVDKIEFDPEVDFDAQVVRTAYDLELTEHDLIKLHQDLTKIIQDGRRGSKRIRFIGRLVS